MARGKYLLVRKESRRESSNLLQWLNRNSSYNHITLWNYKITEWIDWAEFFLSPSQLLSVPRYWFYLYFMNSTLTNFNGARIIIKKEAGNLRDNRPLIVSEMRFELTRANAHYPLKVACLPFHHIRISCENQVSLSLWDCKYRHCLVNSKIFSRFIWNFFKKLRNVPEIV